MTLPKDGVNRGTRKFQYDTEVADLWYAPAVTKPQKLLAKADFARVAGVTRQAIDKALRQTTLKRALVEDRIDMMHPQAVAYLQKPRGTSTRRGPDKKPKKAPKVTPEPDPEPTTNGNGASAVADLVTDSGLDISRYADMTLRELVDRFGSVRALKDWLEALKKIEDIREKRLSNEEVQRALVSRELVKTHVFGFLDAGNRRLLGDTPKTIARRLYGLARSDAPLEDGEKLVREIIGSQLEPQKKRVAKMLREGA